MERCVMAAGVLALVVAPPVLAAGFVHNDNFVVFTATISTHDASQDFARDILDRAEVYRSKIAQEWLGEALGPGSGRTVINVNSSEHKESGLTWANDHPDRKFHNIYLTTSAENALGNTLCHEIVHTVLATRFPHPNRLPPWLEEGIASRYDGEAAIARRKQIAISWVDTEILPSLGKILEADNIQSDDDNSYAAATSLVEYLLTRGNKQTLLQFANIARTDGWGASLQKYYGIRDVEQLQVLWQTWLGSTPQAVTN